MMGKSQLVRPRIVRRELTDNETFQALSADHSRIARDSPGADNVRHSGSRRALLAGRVQGMVWFSGLIGTSIPPETYENTSVSRTCLAEVL